MPPKKKTKAKAPEPEPEYEEEELAVPLDEAANLEEGVTRCVCGILEDEVGWMIQCEACMDWQHGICVGFSNQEEVPDTYFCEKCRPDLHEELLKNLRKNANHPRSVVPSTTHPTSHDGPQLQTHNLLMPTNAASTSVSRSSRSPTPLAARSSMPKRRNTLNSREAAYEDALERGDIEALNKITATQDEEAAAAAKKKRKRSTGTSAADDSSRRKRSSPTPGSVTSERANDADMSREMNDGTASVAGSVKAESGTTRRGKRKKEKEASLDVDIDDAASNMSATNGTVTTSKKHANQYTYRDRPKAAPATSVTPSKPAPGPRTAGSAVPEPSTSSAPSRKAGGATASGGPSHKATQQAQAPASPHAPISTPWGLPDHLSHLSDLLPTPLQGPIDVPVGAKETAPERGAKVKWPLKRTTIGEMRRRVRAMLDYCTKAQLDVSERAKRVASLENFLEKAAEAGLEGVGAASVGHAKGKGKADAGVDYELVSSIANLPEVLDPTLLPSPPMSQSTSMQGTATASTTAMDFSAMTTAQLLASLTQDLLGFQEKFGPGLGGKVYRETAPRERRPRGAAAAAIAAMERSD